jgi:hypothetical protein
LTIETTYNLSTDSNFFGQTENTELVDIPVNPALTLTAKGYDLIGETDDLYLYLKEKNFNIAVLDRNSGYVWYSVYPDYLSLGYSGTSRYFLESGVIIEYYDMDNIKNEDLKSYLSGSKYNVDITYDLDIVEQGVRAHLTFADLGIEFDVNCSINGSNLVVNLPIDSLVETDIEKEKLQLDGTTKIVKYSYKLKSVYLFPYFGSNNYEINGYSMIPDGSGALIRYTDTVSNTAYTKRIYGKDEGITTFSTSADSSTWYLQDELTASLPVFGVNHGYRQAAFLAIITAGSGSSEIDSYPYGYNSYTLNTTFAKFIVRERYTIQTSSNASDSFQLINTAPYPTDYQIEYHFLSNDTASYSGMAKTYRDELDLQSVSSAEATINLSVIGMDYKSGLFGKNYVEMTSYDEVVTIVSELLDSGVDDIETVYIAWSQGGFYDNTPAKPVAAGNLGGKQDFLSMMAYLQEQKIEVSFYNDPLIAFSSALGNGVVKQITLASFATTATVTSLFPNTYYRSPETLAQSITRYQTKYNNLGITSLSLSTVGSSLYSYRDDGENHYREEVIATIKSEMAKLSAFEIGLYQPNSYLWPYIDSYYQAPIESNKYAYITDSIPFVELVLAGSVDLYSTYVNYVSDYDLFTLRLIEYDVEPSFLITMAPTHTLRYTNMAYIYTSEYALWKEVIVAISQKVGSMLGNVSGSHMISHRYIADGIAEVTYANGVTIYVNYSDETYTLAPGIFVDAKSAKAVQA